MKPAGFIIATLAAFGAIALRAPAKAAPNVQHHSNLLESAITYWQADRYDMASAALNRLILRNPKDLADISKKVEHRLGFSLAQFSSEARLRAARLASPDGSLRLRHVTRYEREVLAERLKLAYEQALTEPVALPVPNGNGRSPAAPSASQPASPASPLPRPIELSDRRAESDRPRMYVLQEWLDKLQEPSETPDGATQARPRPTPAPEGTLRHAIQKLNPTSDDPASRRATVDFDGSREEAHFFAQHIRYAESLLRDRLRYDVALRDQPEKREELRHQLDRVSRLLAAIEARAGGALSREEAERLQFERQRMILAYQAQMERRALINGVLIGKELKETGREPGTMRSQSIRIEGEVTSQRGPDGVKRKLEARVVPAIPPEMLQEGASIPENTPNTASQPAQATDGAPSS